MVLFCCLILWKVSAWNLGSGGRLKMLTTLLPSPVHIVQTPALAKRRSLGMRVEEQGLS